MTTFSKAKLKQYAFLKKRKTFSFMRDNGNEIYLLSDAYKHLSIAIDLLAKFKPVTFWEKLIIIVIDT